LGNSFQDLLFVQIVTATFVSLIPDPHFET